MNWMSIINQTNTLSPDHSHCTKTFAIILHYMYTILQHFWNKSPRNWLAVFKQHHQSPATSAPHTQMHQPHNQFDLHGTYENHTAMNTSPAQVCDTECEHAR